MGRSLPSNFRTHIQVALKTAGGLASLIFLAMVLSACADRTGGVAPTAEPAPVAAPGNTPDATPTTVAPGPTPLPTADVPATVIAILTRVAPTDASGPAPTPGVRAIVATAVAETAATPPAVQVVPPTVASAATQIAPTSTLPLAPTPAERSISDIVRSIDAGLYQIITPSASGSGFLVSEQGHIVTNAHVVGQHLTVTVRSISGALDNADVLGKDEALDLAVLLMEKPTPDLRPMVMGEASDIRPGDEVIALGFPSVPNWAGTTLSPSAWSHPAASRTRWN